MNADKIRKYLTRSEMKERNGLDGTVELTSAVEEIVSDAPDITFEEIEKNSRLDFNQKFHQLLPADTPDCISMLLDRINETTCKKGLLSHEEAHGLQCLYSCLDLMVCKYIHHTPHEPSRPVEIPEADEAMGELLSCIDLDLMPEKNQRCSDAYRRIGKVCAEVISKAIKTGDYNILHSASAALGLTAIHLEQT